VTLVAGLSPRALTVLSHLHGEDSDDGFVHNHKLGITGTAAVQKAVIEELRAAGHVIEKRGASYRLVEPVRHKVCEQASCPPLTVKVPSKVIGPGTSPELDSARPDSPQAPKSEIRTAPLTPPEQEAYALQTCMKIIDGLDPAAADRVLVHLGQRYWQ
jgi:hypothetical protein